MKIVTGLWGPDTAALASAGLREHLGSPGVTRLQLNLDDEHVPESVLRLQVFDEPLTCVVSLWCDDAAGPLEALAPLGTRVAAWEVDERVPLAPPDLPDGSRTDGLAQVAFLRRPAELPYDEWLAHWHGPHTGIAMETQATFGYVQNRVVRPLTGATPRVDAVVEELFPAAAMHDIHAFYGSGGSAEELDRRLTRLMASCAVMGADRDLDVVATSRYCWSL
ncbi:MAG: EthD domain-containing protein [Marmoricola sp.]|nr:EthD domain-containing protein [Marmoricola sp.]